MKYIFIGFFYFGWWTGWQMETKTFEVYDECTAYMDAVGDNIKFYRDLNNHQTKITDWDMTCQGM